MRKSKVEKFKITFTYILTFYFDLIDWFIYLGPGHCPEFPHSQDDESAEISIFLSFSTYFYTKVVSMHNLSSALVR